MRFKVPKGAVNLTEDLHLSVKSHRSSRGRCYCLVSTELYRSLRQFYFGHSEYRLVYLCHQTVA